MQTKIISFNKLVIVLLLVITSSMFSQQEKQWKICRCKWYENVL